MTFNFQIQAAWAILAGIPMYFLCKFAADAGMVVVTRWAANKSVFS
jgi:hypothetical protein